MKLVRMWIGGAPADAQGGAVRKLVNPATGEPLVNVPEATAADARKAGADLIFVLFYTESDLRQRSWQESYLKAELGARKVPFIDTKDVILKYVERSGGATAALYDPGDGHHNNLGNQVVGQGILEYLRRP